MFQALLAHLQEALHKQLDQPTSTTAHSTNHTRDCVVLPEDGQVCLKHVEALNSKKSKSESEAFIILVVFITDLVISTLIQANKPSTSRFTPL
jgi:hypothetical protein